MKRELIVSFDVDGILCEGTTIQTELLLRQKRFNEKLGEVSGDYSEQRALAETVGPFARLLQAVEYQRHKHRSMNVGILKDIKKFKEMQAEKKDLDTKLVVVSGRSVRMTELTMKQIREAGFEDLFYGFLLREPGYSPPGWKLRQSNSHLNAANIYCQIDDDPLAGYSVLKTQVPEREKYAFVVRGRATNPQLLARAGVAPHSRLQMVGSVAQALAAISNLK